MTEPTNTGPDEPATSEPTATGPHETAAAEPTKTAEPTERARTKHSAPSGTGSAVRWLAAFAFVVALLALGVAGWVLYRAGWTDTGRLATAPTTTPAPPGPNPQQVADAKTKACGAYKTVSTAVNVANNANPGNEPGAAAVNARLALAAGHTYLVERLDPATPPPLADAIRKYAVNIEEVTMSALSGVGTDDPALAGRLQDWGPLNDQITDLCK